MVCSQSKKTNSETKTAWKYHQAWYSKVFEWANAMQVFEDLVPYCVVSPYTLSHLGSAQPTLEKMKDRSNYWSREIGWLTLQSTFSPHLCQAPSRQTEIGAGIYCSYVRIFLSQIIFTLSTHSRQLTSTSTFKNPL